MRFTCIDFETANYNRSSACQLGVVCVVDGVIRESESWLIRPTPFEFEPICAGKHGITAEFVERCPEFADIWPEIEEFIGESVLVAHNAPFDMSVLRHTLAAYDQPIPELQYLCTVQIARSLWEYPCNSLPFLATMFGIDLDHHDALSDAMACAQIMLRAMQELGSGVDTEFLQRLPISPGVLCTPWGHETPTPHQPRMPPTSIRELFSGRLHDLNGTTVSTTGALGRGITRDHLKELVEAAGGEFHAAPKRTTNLFVVGTVDLRTLATGESLSAKHRRALSLFDSGTGIQIVSADDFLEMLIMGEMADDAEVRKF